VLNVAGAEDLLVEDSKDITRSEQDDAEAGIVGDDAYDVAGDSNICGLPLISYSDSQPDRSETREGVWGMSGR
jgi:hypothetical protein